VLLAIAIVGIGPSNPATARVQESAGKAGAADTAKKETEKATRTGRPIYLVVFDGKEQQFIRVDRVELRERLYYKATIEGKGQYFLSGKDAKLPEPGLILLSNSRLRGDRIGYHADQYFELTPKGRFERAARESEKYYVEEDARDGSKYVLMQAEDGTGQANLTKAKPPLSDPTPPSYLKPKSSN
jgi:hypothetical protein